MPGKKIMLVVPPRDLDWRAFDAMRRILEGRGHRVSVSSIAAGSAMSDEGYTVPVDVRIVDIKTYEYDAFVFIGGEGAKLYFEAEPVLKLAKDVKYKTIGATGEAVVILAFGEVLSKKQATGPHEWAGLLIERGAKYTNEPFTKDDKIFTLQDSSFAEHFANALAESVES